MTIYIASSWKNEHAILMLTDLLRKQGHQVISWIENSYEEKLYVGSENLEKWIYSENGTKAFEFDTNAAMASDLMIFYAYAGNDAHAEMALAWSKGIKIYGLATNHFKKGLMCRMVEKWFDDIYSLLDAISILPPF